MKTSQKLNLKLAMGTVTLALAMSACGAKITAEDGGAQPPTIPTTVANNASQNPLMGKTFTNGLFSLGFVYVSSSQLNVVRTCTTSAVLCQTMGQTASESFSVKMNDSTSVHTQDLGNGFSAQTTVFGNSKTITIATQIVDASGNNPNTVTHHLVYSQTPCGTTTQGAGMEDDFTQTTNGTDGSSATSTGCQSLY